MPNVDVYTSKSQELPGNRYKVKVRYVVNGVSRPERTHVWPDAFADYWSSLTEDEQAEMAERMSLEYVRRKIERID